MIRNPIHIITNADLEQNGGRWKLQGGAVIPVDHSTLVVASAAGDKLVAGSITPVYFVSDAQLATPRFKLMGGDDKRVYDGIVARGIRGGAAIPVYDPNYSAANPWYDPNNRGLCVWGAYRPKGAASFAVSLIDLSGSGNDAVDPGGVATPPWDAVNGWKPDGIADYLITTFTPQNDQSQTVIIQFTSVTNGGIITGCSSGADRVFNTRPDNGGGSIAYNNGQTQLAAPSLPAGNLCVAGNQGYRNGVADGALIGAWGGAALHVVYIGALNSGGVVGNWIAVNIQAYALYECALTTPQVLEIATAMAAL